MRRFARWRASLTIAELIEKHAPEQSPQRIEELVKIFVKATKVGVPARSLVPSKTVTARNWVLADGIDLKRVYRMRWIVTALRKIGSYIMYSGRLHRIKIIIQLNP